MKVEDFPKYNMPRILSDYIYYTLDGNKYTFRLSDGTIIVVPQDEANASLKALDDMMESALSGLTPPSPNVTVH